MSIADGIKFWIGKAVADVLIAMAVVFVVVTCMIAWAQIEIWIEQWKAWRKRKEAKRG